ncbi:MAG: hypothetical protein ACE364_01130 [Chlorobiota bacterium]
MENRVIKIVLTFLSVIAIYFFINKAVFPIIPGISNIAGLRIIISILIALIIGFIVWKNTGSIFNEMSKYIIIGGIIVGSIGFVLGFFIPLIFWPSNTYAPLMSIFIIGPIGFVIGLFGGGIYWRTKVKTNNDE